MLKKTVTYTDYFGVERTEDFYFNLNKAEITEMELTKEGGLTNHLEKIISTKNASELILYFKEIILKAYGEKSADGRRFVKSQELSDAFSQTEAFVEIFMELASDADAAAEFVNGIIPGNLVSHLDGKIDDNTKLEDLKNRLEEAKNK